MVVTDFMYLGSKINGRSDLEASVSISCTKARLGVVKMGPALVSSTLTMKTKHRLMGMYVKPVLLFRLEISVKREKDDDKVGADLSKASLIVLKTCNRKTQG